MVENFAYVCGDGNPLVTLGRCSPGNTIDQSPELFAPGLSRKNRTVNFNNPWSSGREADVITARLTQRLGTAELVVQGGYIKNQFDLRGDEDMSALRAFPFVISEGLKSRSFEARLQSGGTSRLNWVVGVNYSHDDTKNFFKYVDEGTGEGGFFFPGEGDSYADTSAVDLKTLGISANVDYGAADRLTISVGGRYTRDTVTETFANRYLCCTPVSLGGEFGIIGDSEDESESGSGRSRFNDVSPRIAAVYDLGAGNVYATISKGYKAGGFVFDLEAVSSTYRPERAWSYEVGYKGSFFNNRLRLNASLFWLDWRDLQIPSSVQLPGTNSFTELVANAGKATIKGFELDMSSRPVDGLTLGGTLGLTDGKYDRFVTSNPFEDGPIDLSGERLVGAARWTGSAFAQIEKRVVTGSNAFVRGEVRYTGRRPSFDCIGLDDRSCDTPSFTVANLRAGVNSNTWSVTVFVENLLKSDYRTTSNSYFSYVGVFGDYQPRRVGVQFRLTGL